MNAKNLHGGPLQTFHLDASVYCKKDKNENVICFTVFSYLHKSDTLLIEKMFI